MLSKFYRLPVYHCDEHYKEHIARSKYYLCPTIDKLACLSEEDYWMRPIREQYAEVIEFYKEEFLIMIDILCENYQDEIPLIIEGSIIMPEMIEKFNFPKGNSIWMIPTEKFQIRQHMFRGEWVYNILSQCNNPSKALDNWMKRDILYAKYIKNQCKKFDFPCFVNDGNLSKDGLFLKIKNYFKTYDLP